MNQLQMVRMDLEANVQQHVQLPGFLGNTLRGCLGRALLHRNCRLCDLYGEGEFTLPYRLLARKPRIAAQFSTQRVAIPQDHGQRVDGIVGEITYEGEITRYLPYLDLGTKLHIGKKTTRGCGQFEIEIF